VEIALGNNIHADQHIEVIIVFEIHPEDWLEAVVAPRLIERFAAIDRVSAPKRTGLKPQDPIIPEEL
jgi:hypothetical protein